MACPSEVPNLHGKLTIGFFIARNGTVGNARVEATTMNSPAVEDCVTRQFYKMQFPEGEGFVVVRTLLRQL